ncbi:MAG: zinc-ribbon domain-containing protein [Methanomicrobia archaeon]|nr:zinc-ribbon domain-containing protein [Methanomicrobia archaeon]
MVKYCRYCGAENKDDAVFCESCGRSLERKVSEPKKGVSDILRESFFILRKNPMILVPYIGLFILSVVISIAMPSPEPSRDGIVSAYLSKSGDWTNILFAVLGIFAGAIAITITYIYKTENVKMSLGDALRKTMSKTVTLIGTWILYFIILFTVFFVGYFLIDVGFLTIIISLVVLFVLLVFGILVGVFFALIYQGIMIDNLGIIDTFKNSYEIAKRNFWDIFGIMLVVVGILVCIPIVSIMFIGNILSSNSNWIIFAGGLMFFANCYIEVALTLLYLNRK